MCRRFSWRAIRSNCRLTSGLEMECWRSSSRAAGHCRVSRLSPGAADSAHRETDDNSLSGTFLAPVDVPSYADNGSKLYVDRNPRHGNPYFNPSHFMQEPLPGQIGNAMRRFFVGPGLNNSNLALLKNTKISETKEVQFRAEAFNVFNHAQFNNPSRRTSTIPVIGGFGYVTSARDPRIMQVALKFLF